MDKLSKEHWDLVVSGEKNTDIHWQINKRIKALETSLTAVRSEVEELNEKGYELQNLKEREKRIRKFWDCSKHDFEVIANGKGEFESGVKHKARTTQKDG